MAKLRLELVCGSTEAPEGHMGAFSTEDAVEWRGSLVHPAHAEIGEWAEDNGVEAFIEGHQEDDAYYSDAYLYFAPERIGEVVTALQSVGYDGDILDVKEGRLTPTEKRAVEKVADDNGWTFEG